MAGKTAVVTGALGKLGPVWVEALLSAGAGVYCLDHPSAKESDAFSALSKKYGAKIKLGRADVLDRDALETAAGECVKTFGVPHVLVNNAGIDQPPKPGQAFTLDNIPKDFFLPTLTVNVYGVFLVSQVFGGLMAKEGRGSIINIGSLYATVSPDVRLYDHIEGDPPFLKPPAYGASKAAVLNLTKYFATHWGPNGVRVNALSPGGVLGGQDEEFKRKFNSRVPMGRMAVNEDLKGPLVFLASEASSYVTGQNLQVDGGFTLW
ncbi:MAG: SDR family oxidoreductase [Nitrospinae bacterium]|nr:SDR family oxidoreductase [Nitrospinota bacterium]